MEEMISMIDLGLLTDEMAKKLREVRLARSQSGGYSTVVGHFAANAWHDVAEVRERIGMPAEAFDRLRQDIRRTYWKSLDPQLRTDTSVMHGQEVSACLRLWEKRR